MGLVAPAICDLRQLGVLRRRPSRNRVRIVFENEFPGRRPGVSVKERRPCAGLAQTGPAADRNEIVYWLSNRIGDATCVVALISGRGLVSSRLVSSRQLTSFANQRAPEPRRRACAPHQTSSRDYANTIVSYPVRSTVYAKYRHGRRTVQIDRSRRQRCSERVPAAAAGSHPAIAPMSD